jgi:hypothetical protein
LLLIDADQRRAQQRREIEIVFRQQHEAAQRDQVHHGDLVLQLDAVRAGDRHAAPFELADQFARERLAPRHQHHDVAGADRLVMAGQARAPVGPGLDLARDAIGEPHDGTRFRLDIDRQPVIGLGCLGRAQRGPEFDAAFGIRAVRLMRDIDAGRGNAFARGRIGEHFVDELQDLRRGAARNGKCTSTKGVLGRARSRRACG